MTDYNKKAGMRVLAVHTINNQKGYVTVFGRGTIVGAFYPDTAVGQVADEVRAEGPDALNPKIEMDNGDIVWGCECWWMEVHRGDMWLMELASRKYAIIDVSIDDMRAQVTDKGGE